ncbi:hypothetical protein BJ508DRAFT_167134 [Ascobolus immersus RN42]|uniref:Uncharacterized protein n=1 Tax=Ascobolus immersus RN42 TaxID=1160509 RepID=A0A3N4IHY7_ASCIM|nr:hypothetical protein BJ508DRAFT_167134 [Ascobolus immersus RN42]
MVLRMQFHPLAASSCMKHSGFWLRMRARRTCLCWDPAQNWLRARGYTSSLLMLLLTCLLLSIKHRWPMLGHSQCYHLDRCGCICTLYIISCSLRWRIRR